MPVRAQADVLLAIWGEDAAREIADHYGIDLEALGQEVASDTQPAVRFQVWRLRQGSTLPLR